MLDLISSIPTAVRAGLDVQDLPLRATQVSAEHLSEVKGGDDGCPRQPSRCDRDCRKKGKVGQCRGWFLAKCVCA